jgi:hypothetical protein
MLRVAKTKDDAIRDARVVQNLEDAADVISKVMNSLNEVKRAEGVSSQQRKGCETMHGKLRAIDKAIIHQSVLFTRLFPEY